MHTDTRLQVHSKLGRTMGQRSMVTLLFVAIVAAVLAMLWPTTASMVALWLQSSAYGHCFVVIPLAVAMAWRESSGPIAIPVKPYWPGLAAIAAVGMVWLLGELVSAAVVAQFAAVGIISAAMLTVLGLRWARRLAFPLGFLVFAVPFGEGLLPVLMDWTANVTVAALRVSRIPVYREGNFFVVPSGSWSIVEACSGIRFLIAALMTGCIFAWLQYRSAFKRTAFVVLALAVALIANWLRAYTFVLIGHFGGSPGGDAEHLVWGWLIFAAAMFALFLIGLRWTDTPSLARASSAHFARVQGTPFPAVLAALTASLLAVAVWPVAAGWVEPADEVNPVRIGAIVPRAGWQPVPTAADDWAPQLLTPSAVRVQTFAREAETASVYLGVYRGQKQGAEVVSTMNQIAGSDNHRWRIIERGIAEVVLNGEPTVVRTAVVRDASTQFLVWQWYWSAGSATSSDVRLKLQLALQRLTGAADTSAWIAVYTPVGDDFSPGARTLRTFLEAMPYAIDSALKETALQ